MTGARQPSVAEHVEARLDEIERVNRTLNAFILLDRTGALAAAQAVDAARGAREWGRPAPRLEGLVVGVKANIAVRGWPWHAGIGAYRDRVAEDDAPVVAKLRKAGAILVGLTNMAEGALGATTNNPWFGDTANPWGEGLTAGGSSGGSGAAVGAGLVDLALGTDTMGSVRIPSAYCGCVGVKPSRELVASQGVVALSWTLDTVGVHAPSVVGATAGLAAIARRRLVGAPLAGFERPAGRVRVGVLEWGDAQALAPDVRAAFEKAVALCQAAGAQIVPVSLAAYAYGASRRAALLPVEAEGLVVHAAALAAHRDGFSPAFRSALEWARGQSAERLAGVYGLFHAIAEEARAIFANLDVVLAPVAPQSAFALTESAPDDQANFTAWANLADLPALALPISVMDGRPAAIQLIGWRGREGRLLAFAAELEALRGALPRPPLAAQLS